MTRRLSIASLGLAVVLVVVVAALSACGGDDDTAGGQDQATKAAEPTRVRLALAPFQDVISIHVGLEQGFFEDEGIDLRIQTTGEWSAANELMIAGHTELATSADNDVVLQNNQGQDTTLAFPLFTFAGSALMYDPKKHPDWKTFDDLLQESDGDKKAALAKVFEQVKSAKIATIPNDPTLSLMLTRASYDPKDFNIRPLAETELLPALIAGSIDIYKGGIPQRLAGRKQGLAELVDQTAVPETIQHAGYSAHRSWVDKNFEVAKAFQRALFRTQQYIVDNPDESFALISKKLKEEGTDVSPKQLAEVWNVMEFFPRSVDDYTSDILNRDGKFYWKTRFDFVVKGFEADGTIKNFKTPLEDVYYAQKIVSELDD